MKYPGYYGEDGFAHLITRLKDIPEYSWLEDVDSRALQSAAKNAHKAYKNMFAGNADRPRYKSKTEFWAGKIRANMERDRRETEELEKEGWKVIVIWECMLKKGLAEQTLGSTYRRIING